MADPIRERLERREAEHDRIREQVEIETLRDGSQQATTVRNRDAVRSQDAAKTRGDLTRVVHRSNAPKTDGPAKPEKPTAKPTEFKFADGRGLKDLVTGRPPPQAPPREARVRQADARPEAQRPRPAAENARPSGATGIAHNRAVQGRREAAIAERPRNDEIPREQAHLRSNNQRPLTTAQKQGLAARMRAYVANLFKPNKPTSPNASKNLHAGLANKKGTAAGLSLSKVGPLPKGTATAMASNTVGSKSPTSDAKEKGPVIESGKLIACDSQSGDPETISRRCDTEDAFWRLGAGEPRFAFNAEAWHEVQLEKNQLPHVRLKDKGPEHRRIQARQGRDKTTG